MSEQPTPICDSHMHNMGSVMHEHYVVDLEIAKKLERQRDAAVEALKAARKTLSYCAVNPMQLHPSNNSQHIVASNALGDLDAAIDAARKDAK